MKMYRIFGFVATKELPSAPPRLSLPAQKQGGEEDWNKAGPLHGTRGWDEGESEKTGGLAHRGFEL